MHGSHAGIVIAYVAGKTERIRVGSGGVLAPNHVALSMSEQFGALAALHPGQVDMRIGRGPGTLDAEVARVFRGGAGPASDEDYRSGVKAILRDSAERPDVPEPWLLRSRAKAGNSGQPSMGPATRAAWAFPWRSQPCLGGFHCRSGRLLRGWFDWSAR